MHRRKRDREIYCVRTSNSFIATMSFVRCSRPTALVEWDGAKEVTFSNLASQHIFASQTAVERNSHPHLQRRGLREEGP